MSISRQLVERLHSRQAVSAKYDDIVKLLQDASKDKQSTDGV